MNINKYDDLRFIYRCKIDACEAYNILFLPLKQTLLKIARFLNKNVNNDHDFYM